MIFTTLQLNSKVKTDESQSFFNQLKILIKIQHYLFVHISLTYRHYKYVHNLDILSEQNVNKLVVQFIQMLDNSQRSAS